MCNFRASWLIIQWQAQWISFSTSTNNYHLRLSVNKRNLVLVTRYIYLLIVSYLLLATDVTDHRRLSTQWLDKVAFVDSLDDNNFM